MSLKDKFFNRNKVSKESTETSNIPSILGEWKDPQVTHRPTDNEDLSVATDFMCMYCLNIDGYIHFLNTSIDAGSITLHNIDVTPYSPDWPSFKRHMYASHPEQWCYGEVPNTYFKITKSTTSWNKTDKANVADAYIQIRAKLEYGWNFFAVIDGKVQHTLHALPKDETTITSIEWYPRINLLTNKPWTDWRFEKEGETHKRAQNVLPRIVGRTHASITPVLRGMRRNHSSDGHVLERNPKRLARYAHLPPYVNATCIFTEDALKRVQDLRDMCSLQGPGNIGILRMETGHHVSKEWVEQNKSQSVDTPPVKKEQKEKVEEKTVAQEEKLVPLTQMDIKGSQVNLQDVATQIENQMVENNHSRLLIHTLEDIFNYVRTQSQNEDDFYSEHAAHVETKKELTEAQSERDTLEQQVQTLQAKLKTRPRDKTAAEVKQEMNEVTEKSLDKERNRTKYV